MAQNKYKTYDFWLNKLQNNENLWDGLFEERPLAKQSLIVAPAVVNSYKNQDESAFVVYPNAKSLLGFMTYIYLPTAFYGVFNFESEMYTIVKNRDDLYTELKINFPDKIKTIRHMEKLHKELDELWNVDDHLLTEKLIRWTDEFNEDWLNNKGIILSLNIFTSPKELAEFIVFVYESDLDIEMLENDLQMSKDEFLSLANDDIYENEFMSRKFTEILTNRLIVKL